MASSSSNPISIVEIVEYPYPSHVNAPNLVPMKLNSKEKYKVWKTQMLCLLTSHNMVGFINGKFVNLEGNVERKLGDYEAWIRSDALVKSWIFGTISEEAAMYVIDHLTSKLPTADFTAKDVWEELQRICIYDPTIIQQATGNITEETELTSSVANGDADTLKILLDCVERGRHRRTQTPPSICVVLSTLRDLSPKSFDPLVVSIGPLHKDEAKTKDFEGVKELYLHDLLMRFDLPPDQIINKFVEKVHSSMDEIRAAYAIIIPFGDIELAKMMVIDACFILEFCHKQHDDQEDIDSTLTEAQNFDIAHDLILLENQIPFFVLQEIFDCLYETKPSKPLLNITLHYVLKYVDPFRYYDTDKEFPNLDAVNESTHEHLLGYLHRCYKRVSNTPSTAGTEITTRKELAMQIGSNLTAWFSWCRGKPTLLVPTLYIDDLTERILRNLIAYEQSFPGVHNYFTSYAVSIHYIVKDQEDIATLVELNVLFNGLGSNKEAANMLQALSKKCVDVSFISHQELTQLKNFYNSSWVRNVNG